MCYVTCTYMHMYNLCVSLPLPLPSSLSPPPYLSPGSDYNQTLVALDEQYHDTLASTGVGRAAWMLAIAMVIKGTLTVFTFGIQVSSPRTPSN